MDRRQRAVMMLRLDWGLYKNAVTRDRINCILFRLGQPDLVFPNLVDLIRKIEKFDFYLSGEYRKHSCRKPNIIRRPINLN